MDYQATETIILNDEAFVLLLGAAGISDWYGIDLSRKTSFISDRGTVNRHIAELYRKGLIEWGEEKARISDSVRPLLKVLKEAPVCISFSNRDVPGQNAGCYCSRGDVVMIERSLADAGELRLTMMNSSEWFSFYEKGGYLPKVMEAPADMNPDRLLPDSDDLITEFEVHRIPDGHLLEKVMLFDCGVYGMIIDNTNYNSNRKMYSPDIIRNILNSWAGGAAE